MGRSRPLFAKRKMIHINIVKHSLPRSMSSHLNTTHLLEAESFSQDFTALIERLLPETTTGVVWLEMENIEMSPDGETRRRTLGYSPRTLHSTTQRR